MAGSTDNQHDTLITGINITPMMDVVLVLLIIFMATAPLIHRRAVQVNVPKAAHNEPKATATLQIQFTAERKIFLDKAEFDMENLPAELRLRFVTDPALHVSIAAEKSLPYGEVVAVLDMVRGAGIKKVALEVKSK